MVDVVGVDLADGLQVRGARATDDRPGRRHGGFGILHGVIIQRANETKGHSIVEKGAITDVVDDDGGRGVMT
ncbi:hypothetical protein GCM10009654_26390 [Streptomyces hebeiensis]|uniref:Uncharacterized protein n=1 Tax=Streptomyces hebeiensis TaxID=229486 RepID=A0ABN1UU54_9ACTN